MLRVVGDFTISTITTLLICFTKKIQAVKQMIPIQILHVSKKKNKFPLKKQQQHKQKY
jgi:hypothetical protein